jgi:hypothetical protein
MSSWPPPRARTSSRRPWIRDASSRLTCPMASCSCADLLPEDLGLNVPANSLDRDGAPLEHTSYRIRPSQFSAPRYLAPPIIDLALNVKVFASIVQNRESQKHVRTPRCCAPKNSDGVRRTRRLLPT